MAIQYINTGSSANAGNGDSIRLAFTKVNTNFAEVTDRINSTTYTVDNGIFQGISVAVTATILDLIVTGTTTLTNVSITGQVTSPVVFDNTGTFADLVVLNTATVGQLYSDDLSVANTSTFDDIIVNGQVLGDLNVTNSGSFASLYVANTTTLNDLTINGELHIGTYQGFDDFNIIKDDINGLNFRLRNIHADSFTQINLLDNIDGGLNFVHQNSTGDSGNFSAGQNYIYGVTPTDTLNIGKYSDINFFADVDKYYTPSIVSTPSIAITAVDGSVTIAKDLSVTSSTFYLGGKAVAVTPSNGITINGNPVTGGTLDLTNVSSHVIPSQDLTYDLGSTDKQWRSLYVGTSTIFIGGVPLTINTASNTLVIGTSTNSTAITGVDLTSNNVKFEVTQVDGGTGAVTELTVTNSPNPVWVTNTSGNALGNVDFSVTFDGSGNASVVIINGGTGHTVGQTFQLNPDAVGATPPTPTAIDLTKSINSIGDGNYTLADGVGGQIMYLVPNIETINSVSNVFVIVAHARDGASQYSDTLLNPFYYYAGEEQVFTSICTLIYTQDHWQQIGGSWNIGL